MTRVRFTFGALVLALFVSSAQAGGRPASAPQTRPGDPTNSAEAMAQIESYDKEIKAIVGDGNADVESAINSRIGDMNGMREQMVIEITGKKSREQALQEKIQKLTAQAEQQAQNDEMLIQLKKIADLRQMGVARARELARTTNLSASDEAETVIAAAQAAVNVAARRETILATVGGGALPALQQELLATALDLNELNAKLSYMDRRTNELRGALDLHHRKNHAQELLNDFYRREQAK